MDWKLFSLLLLACLAACSTLSPLEQAAGVGDLSFRLLWQGEADLDLHVLQPDGREVGFLPPTAANWAQLARRQEEGPFGILDIDCNAAPDSQCPEPIENIYWPAGTAPIGKYRVWVQLYQPALDGSAVEYVVEIREGKKVRRRLRGSLRGLFEESEKQDWVFGS